MNTLRRTLLCITVLSLSSTSALMAAGGTAVKPSAGKFSRADLNIRALRPPPVLKGKSIDIARDAAARIPYAYVNGETLLDVYVDRGPEFRWWAKSHFLESASATQTLKFQWKSGAKNVASAQWQVTVFRCGPGVKNWEHPVGLVQKGDLAELPKSGQYVSFNIDFKKFAPQPKIEKTTARTFVKPAAKSTPGKAKPAVTTNRKVTSVGAANRPIAAKVTSKPGVAIRVPKLGQKKLFTQIAYYVRVVPLNKQGKPAGEPSEPIQITYGEPEPSNITLYPGANEYYESTKPKLNHPAVSLVKYQPINEQWTNAIYQFVVIRELPMMPYKVGQELDFTPHQEDKSWWESVGDWISDAVDFVAGALNWVADAYQAIKDFALNAVMAVLPDELRGPLTMALDVGLACMGLPPTIPSFSDLTSMGKDYLVRYAADSAGIPPEIAGQAVDAFISASQSTANGGGGNPAVWLKPNPRAYYCPAYLELEIRNTTNEWTQKVAVSAYAEPTNYPDIQNGERLFQADSLTIPALAPGDSFRAPLYLKEYMLLRQFDTDPYAGKSRFWQRYHVGGMKLHVYSIAYLPKGDNPAKYQNASQGQVDITMEKAREKYPH